LPALRLEGGGVDRQLHHERVPDGQADQIEKARNQPRKGEVRAGGSAGLAENDEWQQEYQSLPPQVAEEVVGDVAAQLPDGDVARVASQPLVLGDGPGEEVDV